MLSWRRDAERTRRRDACATLSLALSERRDSELFHLTSSWLIAEVSVLRPPTSQAPSVRRRRAQPSPRPLRACGWRAVSVMLRWSFDGCSMVVRRISGVFRSFHPISAARPPAVPSPISVFCIPPCAIIGTAAPKRLCPFCGADTAPGRAGAGQLDPLPSQAQASWMKQVFSVLPEWRRMAQPSRMTGLAGGVCVVQYTDGSLYNCRRQRAS